MLKTKSGGAMLSSSKCALCGSKKLRFMREQETKGLLSSLSLKKPLRKILLFGGIFFKHIECNHFSVINDLIIFIIIK